MLDFLVELVEAWVMTTVQFPDEIRHAADVRLEAGQAVFSQGQEPQHYLIVLEGCVKVFARSGETTFVEDVADLVNKLHNDAKVI